MVFWVKYKFFSILRAVFLNLPKTVMYFDKRFVPIKMVLRSDRSQHGKTW